jgi:hypothetical protein
MGATLATMLTITTYGVWLRGDARGWVDNGITFPPDPVREQLDQERMKYPVYKFPRDVRLEVAEAIGHSLITRLGLHIYAMCLQSWHSHIVIGATIHPLALVVKCAKDAARWHLRLDRPIWGVGYDKRFCFDLKSVKNRVGYVETHNLEDGLSAKPWAFIENLWF